MWYRYDVPADGTVRLTVNGAIPVSYEGEPGSFTELVCSGGPHIIPMTGGSSYYFMLVLSAAGERHGEPAGCDAAGQRPGRER